MSESGRSGGRVVPEAAHDHCWGPAGAPLSVVEYAEYESSECREAHWVLKELMRELGHQVCIVFRNFPMTEVHPHAQAAAEAAEAADAQGKFWLMHDRLFEHSDQLDSDHLEKYAREIAVDMETFNRDLRSGTPARRVAADVESGRRHAVRSAPTIFLNGGRYAGPVEFLPMLAALQGANSQHDRYDT